MRHRTAFLALLFGLVCYAATANAGVGGCSTPVVNDQGSAGAEITVDSTSGGVTVLAAGTRCGAIVLNTGTATMRCEPIGTAPTTTVGFPVLAGATLILGPSSQLGVKCIRTTGTSTSAATWEER